MGFHVEHFLWLVEGIDASFEEGVLHLVIFFLLHCNFLGWLVVSKLTRFSKHCDVGGWIDFLKDHFELVEQA